MLVKVTKKHIAEARRLLRLPWSERPQRCLVCPLALAISECKGKEWKVSTTSTWPDLFTEKGFSYTSVRVPLSIRAQRWIARFDRNKPVKPFAFRL